MPDFQLTTLMVDDQSLTLRCASLREILPLRQAVLIDGTQRDSAEFEGDHDTATSHIGIFAPDGRPVTCLTLMLQNDGDADAWRVRGMATDPAYRGKGLAAAAMRYLYQALVDDDGPKRLWCNARVSAVAFYRRVGWQTVGDHFMVPAVGEHVRMIRWL